MSKNHNPQVPSGSLEHAILLTVAYADVFDYPLTLDEIHWYLWGIPATQKAVADVLRPDSLLPTFLSYIAGAEKDHEVGYYTLPGRESIVELRRRREKVAAYLWKKACSYGGLISQLPFVRMVALTGSLAAGNVEKGADIDYLIITEPGRLWLCRASIIALGLWAARRGIILCPNYILSENALVFKDRNMYTAREFAQMVPIYGQDTYYRMRACNSWVQEYLPNANGLPCLSDKVYEEKMSGSIFLDNHGIIKKAVEMTLRTPPGGWLEKWEMRRKLEKFNRQQVAHPESDFGPDWCKGHFDDNEHRTIEAYARRLKAIGAEGLERWIAASGSVRQDNETGFL